MLNIMLIFLFCFLSVVFSSCNKKEIQKQENHVQQVQNGTQAQAPLGKREKELFKAIEEQDKNKVKELIQQGVNVNAYDQNKGNVLNYASWLLFDGCCLKGWQGMYERSDSTTKIVWMLIESGAKFAEQKLFQGNYERFISCVLMTGDLEFTHLLINNDFDLKKNKNILVDAASSGNEELFRLCMSLAENFDKVSNEVLMMAAQGGNFHASKEGHVSIIKILLQKNINICVKDNLGNTALMWAVMQENTNILKLLLNHGLGLSDRNNKGQTPLHYALGSHEWGLHCVVVPSTIKFLLELGVNVNELDNKGRTPLINHIRHTCGGFYLCQEAIQLLLEYGADVTIKDNTGKNVLDYLQDYGGYHLEIETLLKQAYDKQINH